MLVRYISIVFLSICCTGCPVAGGFIGGDAIGSALPKPYRFVCPSLNTDLLQPYAIKARSNSKLSLKYQVSYVKQLSGDEQIASSGNIRECFLPYGLRKEVFEQALGGSLGSAGFAAFDVIDQNPNLVLDARILEQNENISHDPQTKRVRLVVEYRLLRPGSKNVVWTTQIITEHGYEQPKTIRVAMPDSIVVAFEAAVRQNLELLLLQLDAFEQQGM